MRASARVVAVLGPTNTGKTHYAIERMLAHRTGVIGLPLRLLAREVYDRIVAARGPSVVALVTGEERIVPDRTRYWVCTVEAMPPEIGADFVAIDEIQLCADPERGHVFTNRLLKARGLHETLFLGSESMRGAIAALVPNATFVKRDRLSHLSWAGSKKISRMPPRSAIVMPPPSLHRPRRARRGARPCAPARRSPPGARPPIAGGARGRPTTRRRD